MVELLARAAQVLAALGGAYLIALWFVLIVWTYRDIQARSNSVFTQLFSTLLVVLFFIPGILLYLLLRPKETIDEAFQRSLEEEYLLQDLENLSLCHYCSRHVDGEFVLCPNCQAQLRDACVGCGKLVDLKWPVCPYCAAPQKERAEAGVRVEAPAPRYIAPEIRRRRGGEAVAANAARPLPATANGAPSEQPAPATAVAAVAAPPVVRPLDRFRARTAARPEQPAAPVPTAPAPSLGDELVRALEAREQAQRIGAGASASAPAAPGPAPAAPERTD
ncbi:MAG: zinc ribbon domain-containing protein [Chloroflexota bacterium]